MTLGGWFRDYVYFPLGGSRTSRVCMVRNLAIVWLLTGLWHGAEWTFVVWGAYFGLFIILEKLWLGRALARAGKWVGHAYALLVVAVGWALFASPGIAAAGEYIASMFSGILMDGHTAYLLSNYAGLIIVLLAIQLPWGAWLPRARQWLSARGAPLFCALYLIVLLLSIAYLVDAAYNPFLYFRF